MKKNTSGSLKFLGKALGLPRLDSNETREPQKLSTNESFLLKKAENTQRTIRRIRQRMDLNKSMDHAKYSNKDHSGKPEYSNRISMKKDFTFQVEK